MNHFSLVLSLVFLMIFTNSTVKSQDTTYARQLMLHLGSTELAGRGYERDGSLKAAAYLKEQYSQNGVASWDTSYFQQVPINQNLFQHLGVLSIDGQVLIPAQDFYVAKASSSLKGTFKLLYLNDSLFAHSPKYRNKILRKKLTSTFVVSQDPNFKERYDFPVPVAGIMVLHDKSIGYWHLRRATRPLNHVVVEALLEKVGAKARKITLDVETQFQEDYPAVNVIGKVEGKGNTDTVIVLGAHYDHLGAMGETVYFPGGNDNASGVAMIMDLARYFAKPENQPHYDLVFIAFTGEEAGLLGSTHFANHPLFDLKLCKQMINLDMVGTGSTGIVVVNGVQFPQHFLKLDSINKQFNFLTEVKQRGESCNSDHCPFYQKGVPSFFIFTTGDEYRKYHTTDDLPQNVPLTKYNELFKLLAQFIKN